MRRFFPLFLSFYLRLPYTLLLFCYCSFEIQIWMCIVYAGKLVRWSVCQSNLLAWCVNEPIMNVKFEIQSTNNFTLHRNQTIIAQLIFKLHPFPWYLFVSIDLKSIIYLGGYRTEGIKKTHQLREVRTTNKLWMEMMVANISCCVLFYSSNCGLFDVRLLAIFCSFARSLSFPFFGFLPPA